MFVLQKLCICLLHIVQEYEDTRVQTADWEFGILFDTLTHLNRPITRGDTLHTNSFIPSFSVPTCP